MPARMFLVILFATIFVGDLYGADKVRIGVSNYNISNLTVGVAQTRGFFKQEGIDAEIIRMNPNVATMALVSADVDYSTLIGSAIVANLKGARVKMIACSLDRTPLSLVSRADIKSVKEVKGKTIGVGSYGSTPDIIARMVVKQSGIDPDTEIKLLALGSDGARLTALKEGVIDVMIVAPPVDFEAKRMGFNIISRAGDIFRYPYNGLATSIKKLSERPDEVKRVLRAMLKANNYILKNRDGTIQVLVHWTKSKAEFAEAGYDSAVNVFSVDGSIPEEGMRVVLEGLRNSMNLGRQIQLSDVADMAPLLEAQRELGLKR